MGESHEEYYDEGKKTKFNNTLPFWGNEGSMNLNALILTNIQSASYFKQNLFKLKTYHEVIDEIYYQVKHMEPWEKGSRKSGQTGMCGGVRGVGAGGIVSSAYCLLFKLYTLRLTRKQLNGLLTHTDSPYIRALGFMFIRYTQPPGDLYNWYEEYLQDEEEIDVKAGGGQLMTIGQMLVQWLTKLDWFSTLFPRIPVPIQKQIQAKLEDYAREYGTTVEQMMGAVAGNNHQEKEKGGRNNNYDNNRFQQRGGDGGGRGGGRDGYGGGYRERDYGNSSRGGSASSSSRARSRSRSPSRKYRKSPDRYESSSKRGGSGGGGRGGSREDDDYYDRDSYKSSSSSHRRRY